MFDSKTIANNNSEFEKSNEELLNDEFPKNRWIVNDKDVSKMPFGYRQNMTNMIKTQNSFLIEEHIMEALACFNMLLLIHDQRNNLQIKYFGGCLIDKICNEHNYFDINFIMMGAIY